MLYTSRDLGLEAAPKPWAEMSGGRERPGRVPLGAGERYHSEVCLFSGFPRDVGQDSGWQDGREQELSKPTVFIPTRFLCFFKTTTREDSHGGVQEGPQCKAPCSKAELQVVSPSFELQP